MRGRETGGAARLAPPSLLGTDLMPCVCVCTGSVCMSIIDLCVCDSVSVCVHASLSPPFPVPIPSLSPQEAILDAPGSILCICIKIKVSQVRQGSFRLSDVPSLVSSSGPIAIGGEN
jgi:hypothetical protein